MNNSNTELSELTLANIEALANTEEGGGFEFNGQKWDNEHHWYNYIGKDYSPDLRDCVINGESWGFSFDFKPGGIGVGGNYQSGSESYQGQKVVCTPGNGNCINGTNCI